MGLTRHCFKWAFLREFSDLLFKKDNIENENKVGHCFQETEFQGDLGGAKMICGPFSPIRSSKM